MAAAAHRRRARPASSSTRPAARSNAATASGAMRLAVVDALRRPLRLWARDRAAGTPTLREAFVYGDDAARERARRGGGGRRQPARPPLPELRRGRPGRDSRLRPGRQPAGEDPQILAASVILAALPGPAGNWAGAAYQADWQPAAGQTLDQHAGPLLDATAYTSARPTTRWPAHLRDRPAGRRRHTGRSCCPPTARPVPSPRSPSTAPPASADPVQRPRPARPGGPRVRRHDPLCLRPADVPARPAAQRTHPRPRAPAQDYGYAYDLVGNCCPSTTAPPAAGSAPPRTSSTARSPTTRCTGSPRPPAGNATSRRPRPGSTPPAAPTSPRSARTPRPTATTWSATCSTSAPRRHRQLRPQLRHPRRRQPGHRAWSPGAPPTATPTTPAATWSARPRAGSSSGTTPASSPPSAPNPATPSPPSTPNTATTAPASAS